MTPSLDSSPSPHTSHPSSVEWSGVMTATATITVRYGHRGGGGHGNGGGDDGGGNSSGDGSGVGMLSLVVSCKGASS